jgi:hypothetical protein
MLNPLVQLLQIWNKKFFVFLAFFNVASESKIFGKKVLFEDRNDLTEILSIFLLQKMSFG